MRKSVVVSVVLLGIALLLLTKLAAVALLPYLFIEWIGGWFARGHLGDRALGFRGGVTLGGLSAVLSLLYVALKDRDSRYLAGAVGVFLALLLVMVVATPAGPAPASAAPSAEWPDPWREGRGALQTEVSGRGSRAEYERDAPRYLYGLAQAAARRQTARVDTQLQWMGKWAEGVPAGDYRYRPTTPSERRERAEQLAGQARVKMVGLRRDARPAPAMVNPSARQPPAREQVIVDVLRKMEGALLLTPEDGYLWLAYGYLLADVDDEAAMGAMSIGIRLSPGMAVPRGIPTEWFARLELMQAASPATQSRVHILLNRAWSIVLAEEGLRPAAVLVEYVERVLPAPEPVERGGLRLAALRPSMPVTLPPGPGNNERATVDFDTAGICANTRVLPDATSGEGGTVVLVFDVLADGTVTGLLVDKPSGNFALDEAAITTARGWCLDPLPEEEWAGVRKRVCVQFQPGSPSLGIQTGAPYTPMRGEGAQLLLALLQYRISSAPPVYPAAAVREGLEGRVLLDVRMGGDGKIRSVRLGVSSGHRLLDDAAIRAAGRWNVSPGAATSEVAEMQVMIPVEFNLQ